ncbi:FMN-binding protein [Anaerosacchariphilus polymeriproducens]|uniref:FMN-binding protein n=1 Tax=Anaerosacchariphilus polymeriproducens TaxID=1812858 RepID=A0A371AX38_9FIRM|nr:FMN-binding protein [Anaerosacchariphilus polymeriproducens]RDU24040.1 FMN-binding protein [Anaerosacchariphilus polymeriproducens]
MCKNVKNIKINSTCKIILQIIFFLTLPGLYINAFAGIKEIYIGILNQTFHLRNSLPILIEAISIFPITILMGRFFCGWMCAFGSYGDFIYFISQKVFHIKFKISEKADAKLKYFKYAVLVFTIIAIWTFDIKVFDSINPNNVFGTLADFHGILNIQYVFKELLVGFVIFFLITVGSLFVERFYCRYFCPLGAVFVLISSFRFFKIKKTRDNCGSCTLCTKSCKMGIPMYKHDKISSGECIQCNKCISACPRSNTKLSVRDHKSPLWLFGILVPITITILYVGGLIVTNKSTADYSSSMEAKDTISEDVTSKTQAKIYKNGTYEGSGSGFRGGITKVNVTISDDRITDIEVVSYQDDKPYFERAYSSIVSSILESQSTDTDSVSGATFSSEGIKDAIDDALSKAQSGTATTSENTDKTNGQESTKESQAYADGTYEGNGSASTKLNVTIKNGQITVIEHISHNYDEPYFSKAFNEIVSCIIKTQTDRVDSVSGATSSSKGINEAISDALSKAQN